ncbi:MAG: hypothetical protein P4L92_01005 [Rudaea sp.]|nr:hypothetical protein [Rudaea sp.]
MNSSDPQWIGEHGKANTAVVFVHGIFGDTLGTWTNANGQTFFDLLRSSPELQGKVDVYAFGFTSKMFAGGSLNIREAAAKLDDTLEFDGVWKYPAIVFVAHSMGGLVVIRELQHHPNRLDQTPLVMLFATPSEGADIAAVGNKFLNNSALRQMRPANENDFLQVLDDDWTETHHPQTRVVCAYETKSTDGVLIVPWTSASRHCDEAARAIEDASHETIVKPDRPKHPSVVVLVTAMNKYVFLASREAELQLPDFLKSGNGWSYKLMDLNHPNRATVGNPGLRQIHLDVLNLTPGIWVTPRRFDVGGGGSSQLDILVMRGDLFPEYGFDIEIQPLPLRHINIEIPPPQAIQEQEKAIAASISSDLRSHLSGSNATTRFNRLPADEQLREVATVANATVGKQHPGLPADVQWLVTADTLSSLGWSNLGKVALDEMVASSKSNIENDPAAQFVGARIAALNAKPDLFAWVPADKRSDVDTVKFQVAAKWTNPSAVVATLDFSKSLQSLHVLQHDSLILQGDIFKAQGDNAKSEQAYFDADKILRDRTIQEQIKRAQGVYPHKDA